MDKIKIKICGMREPENIRKVAALQPHFMGFIFYEKSPRYCRSTITTELLAGLPAGIAKVGVFVNEDSTSISDTVRTFGLDLVQLHGHETPGQCRDLQEAGISVIKAFSVDDRFAFESTLFYERYCDYFLFDTRGRNYGGNGTVFDWDILKNYFADKPYFLSGGLNLENLQSKEFKELRPKPFAIDVNSGFEVAPGLKDLEQLERMMEIVNKN